MSVRTHPTVVVVVYDEQVHAGVARSALKHRWEILDGRTEKGLAKRIMLAHPTAMLLQVPSPAEPATGLIARVRQMFTPPAILAVAQPHSEAVEAAVLAAGASAYLPDRATAEQIEAAVRAVAPGAIPAAVQVEAKTDPAQERAVKTRVRRSPRVNLGGLSPLRHQRRAQS